MALLRKDSTGIAILTIALILLQLGSIKTDGATGGDEEKVDNCEQKCGVVNGVGNKEVECEGDRFGEVKCKCTDANLRFDEKNKQCKTTCSSKTDCVNGADCVQSGESKFCVCLKGTSGDTCDVIDDCVNDGKYAKCSGNDEGNCAYDVVNKKAECRCPQGKGFNEIAGQCQVDNCEQKCGVVNGVGNKEVECEGDRFGEVKCKCKDANLRFDEKSKQCRTTCSSKTDCVNGADCVQSGENKFCVCLKGTSGDTCDVIDDCVNDGKYAKCSGSDEGNCAYDVENKKAECRCPQGKGFNEIAGQCQECKCGTNSVNCTFVKNNKTCGCEDGYADKKGKCEECNCGDGSERCRYIGVNKKCDCKQNFAEKAGKCEDMTEECKKETPKCLETRGYCDLDAKNNTICVCPKKTGYVEDQGCKVSGQTCTEEKPRCVRTNGFCNVTEKDEMLCVCPEKQAYITVKGCADVKAECKAQQPKCLETMGSCSVKNENEVVCICRKKKDYVNNTGCLISNATCNNEKPNCLKTNGFCNATEKDEILCVCPKKNEYLAAKGCTDLEPLCKDKKPKCLETEGICRVKNESKIECACPEKKGYVDEKGCEVLEKVCKEEKPFCQDTNGVCSVTKESKIKCDCPEKQEYSDEKGCTGKGGLSTSAICGIVACFVAVAVIIGLYIMYRRKIAGGPTYDARLRGETVTFANPSYESTVMTRNSP